MKLILIIALLLFTVKTGYGNPTCQYEVGEYMLEHILCAEHAMEIQNLIASLSKNRTTYEEIEAKISGMCQIANSTKCYKELATPIPGPCNDSKKMQHFRNAFRVVLTFNEFMCQNNGTKFLEFVKNGGASCYLHPSKTECYKNEKIAAAISGDNYFKDDSVCLILRADFSCNHHYKQCENPNVNTDYLQILTSLQEKFHC